MAADGNFRGDVEFMRMVAYQRGCSRFICDGQESTLVVASASRRTTGDSGAASGRQRALSSWHQPDVFDRPCDESGIGLQATPAGLRNTCDAQSARRAVPRPGRRGIRSRPRSGARRWRRRRKASERREGLGPGGVGAAALTANTGMLITWSGHARCELKLVRQGRCPERVLAPTRQ